MKIAIDMDGTIVDFTTVFKKKIESTFGIKCTAPYIDARWVFENMREEDRVKYDGNHREIYRDLCDEDFFLNLTPFPGAIEAVKKLAKTHEIYFLTKPLNWDRSAPEKAQWLKQYFPDIEYKIIMVDSAHTKRLINLDVLVDDDKRVLEGPAWARKICIAQPWNEEFRKTKAEAEMVRIADSFADVPQIIEQIEADIEEVWSIQ